MFPCPDMAKGGPRHRNRPARKTLTSAITTATVAHPPAAREGQ